MGWLSADRARGQRTAECRAGAGQKMPPVDEDQVLQHDRGTAGRWRVRTGGEGGWVAEDGLGTQQPGDGVGNLTYRKTARNFGTIMAAGARVTVAQFRAIVPVGGIDPEHVVTPSIYVDRVVRIQVSAAGDLANWHTGRADDIPAVGGATDLAIGARDTFVRHHLRRAPATGASAPRRRNVMTRPVRWLCGGGEIVHPHTRLAERR